MTALYVAGTLAALAPLGLLAWWIIRYVRSSKDRRRAMRMALRIRRRWARLAVILKLTAADPTPLVPRPKAIVTKRQRRFPLAKSRQLRPRLRIRTDEYGAVMRATTVPGVGLDSFEKVTDHLANDWRAVRVTVSQESPGRIRIRAVHRDPLVEKSSWVPTGQEPPEEAFRFWEVGQDEYAADAALSVRNVPGAVVSGLPGSGKSSLLGGLLLARYAPSKRFACVICDGKGGTDYLDWQGRTAAFADDDLEAANKVFRRLAELRAERQRTIVLPVEAGGLGTRNFWRVGPTEKWPWVVVIVDEAHTYLEEIRSSNADKETRRQAELTAENRRLVMDLVKKGRSVGILTVLATQKSTADAIPTAIRDVCSLLASFAQTTTAAAVAALGEDIREYPGASPVELQGDDYVGVMTVKTQGQRGFIRVRTPYVTEEDQARIARATAHVKVDPWALIPKRHLAPVGSVTDEKAVTA
jgi:S-DNA-T family DNA segregation ATPase FtsK/SpoIIIE